MDEKTTPEKQIPSNQDRDHHVDLKEIREGFYKIRKFEIQNLWQRSIFLVTFTVILFTGYGQLMEQLILPKSKDLIHSEFDTLYINCICYILSIIGSTFSVIWIMMAKGSKAWYEIYERRIINIEKESALGIPQKYQMDKGAPWTLNNSLWSQEPGAYSVSKINILLGQVLRVIWVVISVIHSILILITTYSFKEDNTSCDIILYMGAPFTILLIVTIAAQKCLTNILKSKAKSKAIKRPPPK